MTEDSFPFKAECVDTQITLTSNLLPSTKMCLTLGRERRGEEREREKERERERERGGGRERREMDRNKFELCT